MQKTLWGLALAAALSPGAWAQTAGLSADPVAQKVGTMLVESFQHGVQQAKAQPGGPGQVHTVNARTRTVSRADAPAPEPGQGRKITVRAMAYCLRGYTARGTYVQHGTIAVDPRVIPLGSQVFIPGYGWARALDTGGAIQGNTIDLWFPSASQCYQWGSRTVTITVMPR